MKLVQDDGGQKGHGDVIHLVPGDRMTSSATFRLSRDRVLKTRWVCGDGCTGLDEQVVAAVVADPGVGDR